MRNIFYSWGISIKNTLFPKKYRHSTYNTIRRLIYNRIKNYWDEKYVTSIDSLRICDIQYKDTRTTRKITITLGRPGLLIGKAGRTIDDLQKYLTTIYDRKVTFHIVESDLFY